MSILINELLVVFVLVFVPICQNNTANNATQTTLSSEKVSHLMFDNNLGKCEPILKILSPGDS